MKSRIRSTFFLIIVLALLFSANAYSQSDLKSGTVNRSVITGEQFAVTLKNNIEDGGYWQLYMYDNEMLEVLEDRKNNALKTTVIFYALKSGTTDIIFNYITGKTKSEERIIKLNIGETEEEAITENIETELKKGYYLSDEAIEKKVSMIRELISRNLYEKAIEELSNIRKNYPTNMLPIELVKLEGEALASIDNPDYDRAIELFNTYLNAMETAGIFIEEVAEVQLKKAEMLSLNNNYIEAEISYIEVISYYGEYTIYKCLAYIGLADLYIKTDRIEKALSELQKALKSDIEDAELEEVLIRLARIYFEYKEYKDYDLAYKYYSMIKYIFPKGKYSEEVNKRIIYLEENFINYGD